MNQSTWETLHHFTYDTSGEVTAEALANNLLGLAGVFEGGSKALATMLGVTIKDTQVVLKEIELGSYKDHFLFRIIFGEGEDAERRLNELLAKLGIKNMTPKMMISLLAVGAVAFGAYQWHLRSSADPPSIHLENSLNNLSIELGMGKEEVLALFRTAIRDEEKLKRNVVRLVRPDSKTEPGTIMIDGMTNVALPPESLAAVPEVYEKPVPSEMVKRFENIQIVVRALDLDKPSRGWWAIVPDVSDARLSLVVGVDVQTGSIPVGKYFQADIEVIYKPNKAGEKVPKKLILLKKR